MKKMTHFFSDFIRQSNGSKKELRYFCERVFEEELHHNPRYCKEGNVHYRIVNMPFRENGNLNMFFFGKKEYVRICINLHCFLPKCVCSVQMKFVFLYATIVHELEHLRLTRLLKCETINNYREAIAALDQYCYRFWISNGIYDLLTPGRHKTKKRYDSSPAEIHCNLAGMRRAYEMLAEGLSQDCKAKVEKILDGLMLMSKNQEIRFYREDLESPLFLTTVGYVRLLSQRKRMAEHFPVLSLMFDKTEGGIPVDEIIRRAKRTDEDFDKGMLLRCFIYFEANWRKIFEQDAEVKKLVNKMADDYCKSAMRFLSNEEIVKIYLSEEIVDRNSAELVRNVQILKHQMKEYGMQSTAGGVFPLD